MSVDAEIDLIADLETSVACEVQVGFGVGCTNEAEWSRSVVHSGVGVICASRLSCDECRKRAMAHEDERDLVCNPHLLDIHLIWRPL